MPPADPISWNEDPITVSDLLTVCRHFLSMKCFLVFGLVYPENLFDGEVFPTAPQPFDIQKKDLHSEVSWTLSPSVGGTTLLPSSFSICIYLNTVPAAKSKFYMLPHDFKLCGVFLA